MSKEELKIGAMYNMYFPEEVRSDLTKETVKITCNKELADGSACPCEEFIYEGTETNVAASMKCTSKDCGKVHGVSSTFLTLRRCPESLEEANDVQYTGDSPFIYDLAMTKDMNIVDLKGDTLYRAHALGDTSNELTCIHPDCANKTFYYKGYKFFKCSYEPCGQTLKIYQEKYVYEQVGDIGPTIHSITVTPHDLPEDTVKDIEDSIKKHSKCPTEKWHMAPLDGDTPVTVEASTKALARTKRRHLYEELNEERTRQLEKWGVQVWPSVVPVANDKKSDTNAALRTAHYGLPTEIAAKAACDKAMEDGSCTWADIFVEELVETICASNEKDRRMELIQTLTVGIAWLEDMDKKASIEADKSRKISLKVSEELGTKHHINPEAVSDVVFPTEIRETYEEQCKCVAFQVIHAEPGLKIHQCAVCQGTRRTYPYCEVLLSDIKCLTPDCPEFANKDSFECATCTEQAALRNAVTVPAKEITNPDIIKAIEDAEAGKGVAYELPAPPEEDTEQEND